jgi:hypothetical protein
MAIRWRNNQMTDGTNDRIDARRGFLKFGAVAAAGVAVATLAAEKAAAQAPAGSGTV